VVDHPHRLEELLNLLQDKEVTIRGRAAATLARLAETHPARLVRHLDRLREPLGDDSAYVRWHLLYTLGRVTSRFPGRASAVLPDLSAHLTDDDRLVRGFACRALESIAAESPDLVRELFAGGKETIPPSVARIIQSRKSGKSAPGNR
jgi:HEAT repeat protein